MAFKIVLVLSLLGSAFAPPTPNIPQEASNPNIIIGSSVSGPRTFDDSGEAAKADEQNFGNNDIPTFDSRASNQGFSVTSGAPATGIQGPVDFSVSSGAGASNERFQSFSGPRASQGTTVAGSLPGFGPFGGLGSVNSGSVNSFRTSAGIGSSDSQAQPIYEEHVFPRAGPVAITETITNQVTKTHTLRVPVTSDVWVTAVTMVTVPVTQLSTQRRYVPGVAGTVTSVVRITKTPVSIVTSTVDVFPVKTMVSVFTAFKTETRNVEFWQPIVHVATNYEVMTVPVLQTQTLLQRVFTTLTVTRTIDVTSTRPIFVPRSGPIPVTLSRTYGPY